MENNFSSFSVLRGGVMSGNTSLSPRLALLTMLLMLSALSLKSQNCYPLTDCNSLRLIIVREPTYTPPGCPSIGTAGCGDVDPFHQVTYQMYLVYEESNTGQPSYPDFYLNYRKLDVRVKLNRTPQTGFSRIDNDASSKCLGSASSGSSGTGWDLAEKVLFKADDALASINFFNETGMMGIPPAECGEQGAQILFSTTTPTGAPSCPSGKVCYYAKMFPVVVQARPGETINLECDGIFYETFSETGDCDLGPNSDEVPPITICQDNASNGIFNYTVPVPAFPGANTPNANMLLRLADPVTNGDAYDTDIELVNNGFSSIDVGYLEFTAQLVVDAAIPDLIFSQWQPQVRKSINAQGQRVYDLHFTINFPVSITIPAGVTYKLTTLTAGPSLPANQKWTGTILLTDALKTRLKTKSNCTILPTNGGSETFGNTVGDPVCGGGLDIYQFKLLSGNDGCAPYVKAGFVSGNNAQWVYDYLDFELQFDWDGSLAISSVDFSDGWNCPANPTCLGQPANCYEIDNDNKKLKIQQCKSTGISMNFNTNNDAFLKIVFTGAGNINNVTLERLYVQVDDTQNGCVPFYAQSEWSRLNSSDLTGTITTETDAGVEEVQVTLVGDNSNGNCMTTCTLVDQTNNIGQYQFCACTDCEEYTVTPYKDDNPLNGVSTADLVLISKHILGLQPLQSPYKMIAADANKSGSITTFDIVEVRKLILGIYNDFPGNTSWRFVDKAFAFPDPVNPFQTSFPETAELIVGTTPPAFVGIKVGDVNNSVIASSKPADRPVVPLSFAVPAAKKQSTVTIPVTYEGETALEAFQLGLRFDAAVLQLIGPSQGELIGLNGDCFGLTKAEAGEIRVVWLSDFSQPEDVVQNGDVLFYLTFNVLQSTGDAENNTLLQLDDAVLENVAWSKDARELVFQQQVLRNFSSTGLSNGISASGKLEANVFPNPGTDRLQFRITSNAPQKARLMLTDGFGRMLRMQMVELASGESVFSMNDLADLPKGVYVWKVLTPAGKTSGHWVK